MLRYCCVTWICYCCLDMILLVHTVSLFVASYNFSSERKNTFRCKNISRGLFGVTCVLWSYKSGTNVVCCFRALSAAFAVGAVAVAMRDTMAGDLL